MKIFFVMFLIPLVTVGCLQGDRNLTIIGQDGDGESRTVNIPQSSYEQKLGPVVEQIYSETVSTLDQTSLNNPKWEIEKLEVGIGVTGVLGIGEWKLGATPGIRLMFRESK